MHLLAALDFAVFNSSQAYTDAFKKRYSFFTLTSNDQTCGAVINGVKPVCRQRVGVRARGKHRGTWDRGALNVQQFILSSHPPRRH